MQPQQDQHFDTLIIGGGIFGAGAAREAALAGWSTVLLESRDFGAATSSASSKLLHGGLRYLASGRLRLMREALRERELLHHLAPSLAQPTPFLAPLRQDGPFARWKLQIGLFLYDFLSGAPAGRRRDWLDRSAAIAREPALSPDSLRGAGLYWDTRTDDAGLVLATLRGAEAAGAEVANYTTVTAITPKDEYYVIHYEHSLSGQKGTLTARTIINAAGPWSDQIRRLLIPNAEPRALYSKGVHIVVEQRSNDNALFLSANDDGRIFFVIPFHGRSLIGTTDSHHSGLPSDIRVDDEDIDYLIQASQRALAQPIRREEIISSFVGLRTLAIAPGSLAGLSREETIWEEPRGVIHVVGGKLTTFRRIARRMVQMASATNKCPMDDGKLSSTTPLPESKLRAGALEAPLAFTDSDFKYAVNELHVQTALDFARRRLPLTLIRRLTASERHEIAGGLGVYLGWPEEMIAKQAETMVSAHE